jgi:hypothetical protein
VIFASFCLISSVFSPRLEGRSSELEFRGSKDYVSRITDYGLRRPHADTPIPTLLCVCRPVIFQGRRHRPLNPWALQDAMLLEAISRGEFTIQGLRNRELQRLLYPAQADRVQKRRRSAAITRRLALLRAHGLIKKVSGTHRYILTHNGRRIITALLTARRADVDQLTRIAA